MWRGSHLLVFLLTPRHRSHDEMVMIVIFILGESIIVKRGIELLYCSTRVPSFSLGYLTV